VDTPGDRPGEPWDVLVVGGGITGAGLLLEAARMGHRVLLVEARDFAWGSSSRSSKLVHGGMRYLKQLRLGLTRTLLVERDRLLSEVPGLVDPLGFLLPQYRHRALDLLGYGVGVMGYDLLRGRLGGWSWRSVADVERLLPGVARGGLIGGIEYLDAVTDDARLVLRVLREGVAAGGVALSYVGVEALVRERGRVVGAELRDDVTGAGATVRARVVVNATGAGVDAVRALVGERPRLRPLRGAHLVLSAGRVPLSHAMACRHPRDGRYVYVLPWEGAVLLGCTDVDHGEGDALEPRATAQEVEYLLEFSDHWLPGLGLREEDVLGTFAGVRPVVGRGRGSTHEEPRDSVVWEESGLLTVISGKLTAFRSTVRRGLASAARHLPASRHHDSRSPYFTSAGAGDGGVAALPEARARRLVGRYGPDAPGAVAAATPDELDPVPGTDVLWAELRWAAHAEGVVHLDDLLLRRARVGLLLPRGGVDVLPRVRAICQAALGWDDETWRREVERYVGLWSETYAPPGTRGVPLPGSATGARPSPLEASEG
jgi:glycerol-3-phosphate dehydrogenase